MSNQHRINTSLLTPKQHRFVDEYLIDLNATQAAIRAGYSAKTACEQGARLLANAKVSQAVAERQGEISETLEVSQERVIAEFARMAFYDPKAIAGQTIEKPEDIAKLPEDVRRSIVGWSWDRQGNFVLKLADKNAALSNLGRHLGLFKDRLEVDASADLKRIYAELNAREASLKDA